MRASVIIRINGGTDSVIINGQEFDRSKMTREERGTVRKKIRDWRFPRMERSK